MRILFLSSEFPPDTDGIGAYVASMVPALAQRGHEVHVLSCVTGQPPSDLVVEGVHVHRRDAPLVRGSVRLLRSLRAAERLATALACRRHMRALGRFDVVEAPDYMAEGLLVTGAPVVAHLHTPVQLTARHAGLSFDWNQRAADWLERLAVRRSNLVTAPSRLLVSALRDIGWLAHRTPEIIAYPVDLHQWEGVSLASETQPVVLMVGRLEARKDPSTLLAAAVRMKEDVPGLQVVYVGRSIETRDGVGYGDWLATHAARSGVDVRLVPHVARDELVSLYALARVLAVPSRFDNFPMVVLEAMASGRAVVCSDEVGSSWLVERVDPDAVVPVGDPDALATALLPYLTDAVNAARTGEQARAVVADECSPPVVAARREACYVEARRRWVRRRPWRQLTDRRADALAGGPVDQPR